MRKLITIFLLSATLVFTSSKCCDDILVLCDLAVQLFQAPQSISIGQSFNLVSEVINSESTNRCELTDIAQTTSNLIDVFFENAAGGWDLVGSAPFNQDELGPSEVFSSESPLTFGQSGNYRLDFYTDAPDSVNERNETNNDADILTGGRVKMDKEALQKTNNYASLFITVLPLPDGTTKLEGKPIVEFK